MIVVKSHTTYIKIRGIPYLLWNCNGVVALSGSRRGRVGGSDMDISGDPALVRLVASPTRGAATHTQQMHIRRRSILLPLILCLPACIIASFRLICSFLKDPLAWLYAI